jgi:predicted RNA-binding protein with EMAP domain
MAAKRSREARRSRENQISLRASYLEKDNAALKEELLNVKEELQSLRETLLIAQQQNDRMSHQQQQQQQQLQIKPSMRSNNVMLNNN